MKIASFALLVIILGCSQAPSGEILQSKPIEEEKISEVSLAINQVDSLLVETIITDLNSDSFVSFPDF